jgi:hypothetical protein
MQRNMFGLKRDEVKEHWRKLHDKNLHNLNSSPNLIRIKTSTRIRWTGNVASVKNMRNACKGFCKNSEVEILGRQKREWEDIT